MMQNTQIDFLKTILFPAVCSLLQPFLFLFSFLFIFIKSIGSILNPYNRNIHRDLQKVLFFIIILEIKIGIFGILYVTNDQL